MAVASSTKTVTDGLVFYVDAANTKSYLGSGTVWSDLSSTSISGSLTNGPTFTTSTGSAIRFDGTNDYVRVSDNDVFNFTRFTVIAWFKSNIFPANSQYRIVNHQESGPRAWGMQMGRGDYVGTGTSSDMLLFCHSSNGTTWRNLSSQTRLSENKWYHGSFTSDATTMNLYLNGILDNTTASLGNQYSTITGDIGIGVSAEGFNAFWWNGDIASVSIYNRALSSDEILQNYESTRERFALQGIARDPDASLFLRTAGITNTNQQFAIDNLVIDLKNAGLWSKMKAIYPFVGGTASTHKWNLKDPRDVDAAFRLTFSGGWTHSSTGADPNGTTGYANTFLTPVTHLTENTTHISYYSRENTSGSHVEIGSWGDPNRMGISCKYNNSNVSDHYNYNTNRVLTTGLNGDGYYVATRTSNTVHKLFRNNTQVSTTNTSVSSGWSSLTRTVVLAYNNQLSSDYSNKECAFATIGDGLTDSEASSLYTIVQTYQTTLGRQV